MFKLEIKISPYEWEGETEFTYEIRGYNIYYSTVGFKTQEEAQIAAEERVWLIRKNKK